ncbi:small, acid-soluble spore protein, alpha/beta type [Anaeromicrobium sediminis]|uniref:Small, acid-soluble spore protein, alpha/beta type n=1 Tax=Anaeromicrobium sediminis TaxID=1478221 RepID=A0A267MA72_9FIRM|nr:small, acid-soluble spore protein, alpha/beta type [Anaeromicrobium sediminis]PAB55745.1 small, acid-soluble spore protein, alpha/beta type [Anaeromicrobium sediminis]
MSKRNTVVPGARRALDEFKAEIASEFGLTADNITNNLKSSHTGYITRELVKMGEKEMMKKYNK